MINTRAFRPTWWGAALALAGCAAFIALGNWQTHRAQEKRALAARVEAALAGPPLKLPAHRVEAAQFALRRVVAQGEFVPAHTVFLDNKIHQGRVGYEVVTPLKIAGGLAARIGRPRLGAGRAAARGAAGGSHAGR